MERHDFRKVTHLFRGMLAYDTTLYTAKGIYEICRWSRQPKADAFFDFVYDVLEGLRIVEYKITPSVDTKLVPTENDQERKKEQIQILIGNATGLISDVPMLPKPQIPKTYTASEIWGNCRRFSL